MTIRQRVRRLERERDQVARFLAEHASIAPQSYSTMYAKPRRRIEEDGFDVHAARDAAAELVALGAEQGVFEDWCRARGKGPENREPFMREAWVCTACDQVMRRGDDHSDCRACGAPAGEVDPGYELRNVCDGWPGNLARRWPGDSRAPMGRRLAKLGRSVLRALEGQPSECTTCNGWGKPSAEMERDHAEHVARRGPQPEMADMMRPCGDCRGTGRNLRGVLPPVRLDSAEGARVCTVLADRGHVDNWPKWADAVGVTGDVVTLWVEIRRSRLARAQGIPENPTTQFVPSVTRVAPRGKHHDYPLDVRPADIIERRAAGEPEVSLDVRIQGRRWWSGRPHPDMHEVPLAPGFSGPRNRVKKFSHLPAWARGEVRRYLRRYNAARDEAMDQAMRNMDRFAEGELPGRLRELRVNAVFSTD